MLDFLIQPFISRQQAGEARTQAKYQAAMSKYYARVADVQRQNADNERLAARYRAEQEAHDRTQAANQESSQLRRRRAMLEAQQSTAGVIGTMGSAAVVSSEQAASDTEGMMQRDKASEQARRIMLWEGEAARVAGYNAAMQTDFQASAAQAEASNLRSQAKSLMLASNLGFAAIGLAAVAPIAAPLAGAAGLAASVGTAAAGAARAGSMAASGMASYYQATSGRPGAGGNPNQANEAASLISGAMKKPAPAGVATLPATAGAQANTFMGASFGPTFNPGQI